MAPSSPKKICIVASAPKIYPRVAAIPIIGAHRRRTGKSLISLHQFIASVRHQLVLAFLFGIQFTFLRVAHPVLSARDDLVIAIDENLDNLRSVREICHVGPTAHYVRHFPVNSEIGCTSCE